MRAWMWISILHLPHSYFTWKKWGKNSSQFILGIVINLISLIPFMLIWSEFPSHGSHTHICMHAHIHTESNTYYTYAKCSCFLFALLRFDCGSGTGKVRSDTEVILNQWNTLIVYRYRWDAWIQLNNGQRVQGRSKVNGIFFYLYTLNINMYMYVVHKYGTYAFILIKSKFKINGNNRWLTTGQQNLKITFTYSHTLIKHTVGK